MFSIKQQQKKKHEHQGIEVMDTNHKSVSSRYTLVSPSIGKLRATTLVIASQLVGGVYIRV